MHFFKTAKFGESMVCRYFRLLRLVERWLLRLAGKNYLQTLKLTSRTIRTYPNEGRKEFK